MPFLDGSTRPVAHGGRCFDCQLASTYSAEAILLKLVIKGSFIIIFDASEGHAAHALSVGKNLLSH